MLFKVLLSSSSSLMVTSSSSQRVLSPSLIVDTEISFMSTKVSLSLLLFMSPAVLFVSTAGIKKSVLPLSPGLRFFCGRMVPGEAVRLRERSMEDPCEAA